MKLSIIVPIFNTSLYIEKCVNSLLNQTYRDFEICLIDDGSTDNSLEVCNKFLNIDNRIKVYHKNNKGLSDTRNYGINISKGEYLLFLDSDDWFDSIMIEKYVNAMEKSSSDVIIQGFRIDYERENNSFVNMMEEEKYYSDNDLYKGVIKLEKKGLLNSSCNKIYKKSIIINNNLFFDLNAEPAEDLLFNCKYFSHIKKMGYLSCAHYHYMKREINSLTIKYIPNYENKILSYHCSRKQLFDQIGIPEKEKKILLDNSLCFYTLTAISNIYRKNNLLNFKKRNSIINFLFSNKDIREAILNCKLNNLFYKIMRFACNIKNTCIINIIFSVLFWSRYTFNGIYKKLRIKILYDN